MAGFLFCMPNSPRDDNRSVAVGFKSDLTNIFMPWEGNPTTGAGKVDLVDSLPFKSTTGVNGGPVIVGTTAVAMTFTGVTMSISLMSDADNTQDVWWGKSDVTSDGSNALGRLTQDRAVTIEFDDSSIPIYVVASAAGAKIYKVALI